MTLDPCTDGTVTGNLVSLHHVHPPLANTCNCRIDANTNTTTTNDTNNTNTTNNVQITAYDVHAPAGSERWVVVSDASGGGGVVLTYSGETTRFPAVPLPELSSSALRVAFAFHDVTAGLPLRVWLGFQGG